MSFYDLAKEDRVKLVEQIKTHIVSEIKSSKFKASTPLILTINYFSDEDTYIRKSAYLSIGRIYIEEETLQSKIISVLDQLHKKDLTHIRQTVINAAGEIGKTDFQIVQHFFEKGLFDEHHSVRNAVIGSVKRWEKKILSLF